MVEVVKNFRTKKVRLRVDDFYPEDAKVVGNIIEKKFLGVEKFARHALSSINFEVMILSAHDFIGMENDEVQNFALSILANTCTLEFKGIPIASAIIADKVIKSASIEFISEDFQESLKAKISYKVEGKNEKYMALAITAEGIAENMKHFVSATPAKKRKRRSKKASFDVKGDFGDW